MSHYFEMFMTVNRNYRIMSKEHLTPVYYNVEHTASSAWVGMFCTHVTSGGGLIKSRSALHNFRGFHLKI